MATLILLTLLSSAAALRIQPAVNVRPGAVASQRAAAPVMQFGQKKEKLPKGWRKVPSNSRPGEFSYENTQTKQRFDKLPRSAFGGSVYDDEVDTYSGRFAFWKPETSVDEQGNLSDVERAGFTEDGKDLANEGLSLYLAFVPFLLFAFAYGFGLTPSSYGQAGNFG